MLGPGLTLLSVTLSAERLLKVKATDVISLFELQCTVAHSECPLCLCFHTGMAQMRKLTCDGIRTNSREEPHVPLVSARQEILTSLVSALDSVVSSEF